MRKGVEDQHHQCDVCHRVDNVLGLKEPLHQEEEGKSKQLWQQATSIQLPHHSHIYLLPNGLQEQASIPVEEGDRNSCCELAHVPSGTQCHGHVPPGSRPDHR